MKILIFSIAILCLLSWFIPNSFSLDQESQQILNNYNNYEQYGSPPATSHPYSPNNSPPETNAVPVPKTNVVTPTTQSGNPIPNSTTTQPQINGSWIIGGLIVIAIIIVIAKSVSKSRVTIRPESGQRRGWTEIEKEQVRVRQDGKCNMCGRPPPRWEYHHRDGNRSNNSLRNCEGLCPNCHSVKTHDE